MLITRKMLLALTLVAALIGGTVGGLMLHSSSKAENAPTATTTTPSDTATQTGNQDTQFDNAVKLAKANTQLMTPEEQAAYRQGYNDCSEGASNGNTSAATFDRVATRTGRSSRRAYYDYNYQPRGRTFWQKHRDKLTMAIGTGGGALIGGLIGGGKGAGIGALSGLGGSALYTYKLRHRSRY